MDDCTVMHRSEDVGTMDIQGLQAVGLKREPSGATHKGGTSSSDARDGGEARNSADALPPTFEGKVVAEFQQPVECAHEISIRENAGMGAQENAEGDLADTDENRPLVEPAKAAMTSQTYNQPSQAPTGKNGGDSEEQRATQPRNLPRQHLNAKSSPMSKPKFDASSFEDPVCDEFWKGVWVACATHNVGVCYIFSKVNIPPTVKTPR